MANLTTLNELIEVFRDISDRHLQINDFGFGPIDKIGESREMNYPYLWVMVQNNSTLVLPENGGGASYIDFSIEFIIADKINDTIVADTTIGEESTNGSELSSDCLQIINDIVAEIGTHPYYVENNISLIDQVSLSPGYDDDDGRVNNWTAELELRMPFRLTYCGAPMTDKSTSVLAPTTCDPVTITDSDGTTEYSIAAGGDFNCTPAVSAVTVSNSTDSYSVSTAVDLELPNIIFTDSDGLTSSVASMTDIVATSAVGTGIQYSRPSQPYSNASRTGDTNWNQQNSVYDFTSPTYSINTTSLDYSAATTAQFRTLDANNVFGNTARFTENDGTALTSIVGPGTQSYVIDHLTGYGWSFAPIGTTYSFNGAVDASLTKSVTVDSDTYSDFSIPSINDLESIFMKGFRYPMNYLPFSFDAIGQSTTEQLWTGEFNVDSGLPYSVNTEVLLATSQLATASELKNVFYFRKHY